MSSSFGLALEATTLALNAALPPHGFTREPRRIAEPSAWRRWWVRDIGWKSDVVEIVYRRGGELSVVINLLLWLPVGGEQEPHILDGRGLDTPLVPRIFPALTSRLYARRVARLVRNHLSWFDQYSTPHACLARVSAEDRNGPRAGKRLEAMVRHLETAGGGPRDKKFS